MMAALIACSDEMSDWVSVVVLGMVFLFFGFLFWMVCR